MTHVERRKLCCKWSQVFSASENILNKIKINIISKFSCKLQLPRGWIQHQISFPTVYYNGYSMLPVFYLFFLTSDKVDELCLIWLNFGWSFFSFLWLWRQIKRQIKLTSDILSYFGAECCNSTIRQRSEYHFNWLKYRLLVYRWKGNLKGFLVIYWVLSLQYQNRPKLRC